MAQAPPQEAASFRDRLQAFLKEHDVIQKFSLGLLTVSFAGSALVMKLAPAAGLLPREMSDHLVKQYQKFYEALRDVPGLHWPLEPVGNAHGLMVYVAAVHLVASSLLVLPSGRWPAVVASLWVMITMVGAEYCLRATQEADLGKSVVHLALFVCALMVIIFKYSSLGLMAFAMGLVMPSEMEDKCASCYTRFEVDGLFCRLCGRRRLYESSILQLLLAGTFTGSAVVMKLGPALGLVQGDFATAALNAYQALMQAPLMARTLDLLGIGTNTTFMLILATAHLVFVALLTLPGGIWPAKCAGFWMMATMVGAEYCTRATGTTPPGTPPGMEKLAMLAGSGMHAGVFLAAFIMVVCELPALRLLGRVREFWHVPEEKCPPQCGEVAAMPEKAAADPSPAPEASSSSAGIRRRDMTPDPRKQAREAS